MTGDKQAVRIGVAGLNHDHVFWVLRRLQRDDVDYVGFCESDTDLARRYTERFNLKSVFHSLDEMIEQTQPEAVIAFGSIFDHLSVVQACAPRGIHVMVEKPLAVSMEHARQMAHLAQKHNIHLLTNYETTWYASTDRIYSMIRDENLVGDVWKVIVNDGHKGPVEIGCTPDFLAWLTDPVLNGGGAIIDFGCYGVNLITRLMNNERPLGVFAVTQQIKSDIYPKVDDESTIILSYPAMTGVIQGSWNWATSRKDMIVYGQTGSIHALDRVNMNYRLMGQDAEQSLKLDARPAPYDDPFAYLAAVVRGTIKVTDDDLSSLANNLLVVEILDAARESAKTGKMVTLATR